MSIEIVILNSNRNAVVCKSAVYLLAKCQIVMSTKKVYITVMIYLCIDKKWDRILVSTRNKHVANWLNC